MINGTEKINPPIKSILKINNNGSSGERKISLCPSRGFNKKFIISSWNIWVIDAVIIKKIRIRKNLFLISPM